MDERSGLGEGSAADEQGKLDGEDREQWLLHLSATKLISRVLGSGGNLVTPFSTNFSAPNPKRFKSIIKMENSIELIMPPRTSHLSNLLSPTALGADCLTCRQVPESPLMV